MAADKVNPVRVLDQKRIEHIEMDISDFKKFYKEIETIHNMLSIMRWPKFQSFALSTQLCDQVRDF